MEGLLLLLILYSLVFKVVSKKQKAKKAQKGMKPDSEALRRAEKAAKEHNEQLRRQLRMDDFVRTVSAAGEGESAAPVFSEGIGHAANYRGSLQADSSEGECICDPALEHGREPYQEEDSVYATEISDAPRVDFSAQGILQGVVMSEILKRPAERFRR